jgi:hypothetical protein
LYAYLDTAREDTFPSSTDKKAIVIWEENGNSIVPWTDSSRQKNNDDDDDDNDENISKLKLCIPSTYFDV